MYLSIFKWKKKCARKYLWSLLFKFYFLKFNYFVKEIYCDAFFDIPILILPALKALKKVLKGWICKKSYLSNKQILFSFAKIQKIYFVFMFLEFLFHFSVWNVFFAMTKFVLTNEVLLFCNNNNGFQNNCFFCEGLTPMTWWNCNKMSKTKSR